MEPTDHARPDIPDLISELSYQIEVNRIMLDRGRSEAPKTCGILSKRELHELTLAYKMGMSPNAFAATLPDTHPQDGSWDEFTPLGERTGLRIVR